MVKDDVEKSHWTRGSAQAQKNRARKKVGLVMSSEIHKSRLLVLSSHFTDLHSESSLMASEKEAALAAVPSDSPTM